MLKFDFNKISVAYLIDFLNQVPKAEGPAYRANYLKARGICAVLPYKAFAGWLHRWAMPRFNAFVLSMRKNADGRENVIILRVQVFQGSPRVVACMGTRVPVDGGDLVQYDRVFPLDEVTGGLVEFFESRPNLAPDMARLMTLVESDPVQNG